MGALCRLYRILRRNKFLHFVCMLFLIFAGVSLATFAISAAVDPSGKPQPGENTLQALRFIHGVSRYFSYVSAALALGTAVLAFILVVIQCRRHIEEFCDRLVAYCSCRRIREQEMPVGLFKSLSDEDFVIPVNEPVAAEEPVVELAADSVAVHPVDVHAVPDNPLAAHDLVDNLVHLDVVEPGPLPEPDEPSPNPRLRRPRNPVGTHNFELLLNPSLLEVPPQVSPASSNSSSMPDVET